MATLSGSFWIGWADNNAKTSNNVGDLAGPFRGNVMRFKQALENAGAAVDVTATKRSALRAYLFHWCWLIGLGRAQPSDPPPEHGVDILWDHGDAAASREGAKKMIDGFGLAVPPASNVAPSLTSLHIAGKAIDMDINWAGMIQITTGDGTSVPVPFMPNVNNNTALHRVGASYGVIKLVTDAPHWSETGH
jgi:hypothetical protein